ncbi:uncharacterized protein METZ01_LOCUS380713, partial [marine metagenome]
NFHNQNPRHHTNVDNPCTSALIVINDSD